MKSQRSLKKYPVLLPVILGLALLAGGADKIQTTNAWGDPQTGLILKYKFPEGQVLKYRSLSDEMESSEVMGQIVEAETKGTSEFSFLSKGLEDGDLLLEVTIDALEIISQSTQGELSPDMTPVIGKSFEMTLSSLGEELDVSGAEELTYEMGVTGERNLAARFQAIFPNLPGTPLKMGDSWTSIDTISDKGETMSVDIQLENVNTLEALETMDGMECVRIKAKVTGTITGEGSQQGIDLTIDGTYEGSDTWYFAYKEGIFVKIMSEGVVEAMVAVGPPANMDMPVTQKMSQETFLIK